MRLFTKLFLPVALALATGAMLVQPVRGQTVATQPESTVLGDPDLSGPASQVLRMAQAGVENDILLAYINDSASPFNLSSDDILYLRGQAVPSDVIAAMAQHDTQLGKLTPSDTVATPEAQQSPPLDQSGPPSAASVDQSGPPSAASVDQSSPPAPSDQAASGQVVQNPPDQVKPFYQALSAFGSWICLAGSGWCWQPKCATDNPDWKPYCDDGQWRYCEAGWYWDSSCKWGWACFHYGRWDHAKCGWVWCPDTVWAPAWVTWRQSSECGCGGWAPMPPSCPVDYRFHHFATDCECHNHVDYTFVPYGHICDHNLRPSCLPPERVKTIYVNTVVCGKCENRGAICVNRGIDCNTVSKHSQRTIPLVAMNSAPVDPKVCKPGIVRQGGVETICRPNLAALPKPKASAMVAQQVYYNQRALPHKQTVSTSPAAPPLSQRGVPSTPGRPGIKEPSGAPNTVPPQEHTVKNQPYRPKTEPATAAETPVTAPSAPGKPVRPPVIEPNGAQQRTPSTPAGPHPAPAPTRKDWPQQQRLATPAPAPPASPPMRQRPPVTEPSGAAAPSTIDPRHYSAPAPAPRPPAQSAPGMTHPQAPAQQRSTPADNSSHGNQKHQNTPN